MRGRPSFLDRKQCYDLWNELGSLYKVRQNLGRQGIVNPNGSIPSESGVKISAWKWVLYHPEEVCNRFKYRDTDNKRWLKILDRRARDVLSTRIDRYINWRKDVYEPYAEKLCQNSPQNTD